MSKKTKERPHVGALHPAALGSVAGSSLTLPVIGSATVPFEIIFTDKENSPRWARVACFLRETGMLDDSELLAHEKTDPFFVNSYLLVEKTIKKWFLKKTEGLRLFGFDLGLSLSAPETGNYELDEEIQDIVSGKPATDSFFVSFFGDIHKCGCAKSCILKEKTELAEKTVPGLGETALWCLSKNSRQLPPVWFAKDLIDVASYLYWGGCKDDVAYMEDYGITNDEYCGIKKTAIEACFPSWVMCPEERIKEEDLVRIINSKNKNITTEAKNIARQIYRIGQFKDDTLGCFSELNIAGNEEILSDAYYCFCPELLFRWDTRDCTVMIFDDFMQLNQEEQHYSSIFKLLLFNLNDPLMFKSWIANMEKQFCMLKEIDLLAQLLDDNN